MIDLVIDDPVDAGRGDLQEPAAKKYEVDFVADKPGVLHA